VCGVPHTRCVHVDSRKFRRLRIGGLKSEWSEAVKTACFYAANEISLSRFLMNVKRHSSIARVVSRRYSNNLTINRQDLLVYGKSFVFSYSLPKTRQQLDPRQRILEVVDQLFYVGGVRACSKLPNQTP
jgi:hypothetical protein